MFKTGTITFQVLQEIMLTVDASKYNAWHTGCYSQSIWGQGLDHSQKIRAGLSDSVTLIKLYTKTSRH